jgi:hypothetical protein
MSPVDRREGFSIESISVVSPIAIAGSYLLIMVMSIVLCICACCTSKDKGDKEKDEKREDLWMDLKRSPIASPKLEYISKMTKSPAVLISPPATQKSIGANENKMSRREKRAEKKKGKRRRKYRVPKSDTYMKLQ